MSDDLMARYLELAKVQNIESVAAYAYEWHKLAADAQISGRINLGAMCEGRGNFYAKQDEGEYLRIIDRSLSELISVSYCEAV